MPQGIPAFPKAHTLFSKIITGSPLFQECLVDNGFDAEYIEVDADHGGMVPLVLPDVFEFFERARSN